jgi:hypothetical protein
VIDHELPKPHRRSQNTRYSSHAPRIRDKMKNHGCVTCVTEKHHSF